MQPASRTAFDKKGFLLQWGGVGQNLFAESQSCLYPHMRAKCGRDPTPVSKKVPFNFISRCDEPNMWCIQLSDYFVLVAFLDALIEI